MTSPQASDLCEVRHIHSDRLERVGTQLEGIRELAELFKILADETRLKLVYALSQEELCVCDLAALTGMTVSNTSHHLRLLRAHRLVKSRKQGRMVFYSLDDGHMVGLVTLGMDHMKEAARG
ncbi:MAG: ArsR/SmtB family transcription factor [Bacillota bacterium]